MASTIESIFNAIALKDDSNMAVAKAAAVITSLLDDTKLTIAQKRRVLDIVAGGYKGKVIGSNQNMIGFQSAAAAISSKQPSPSVQNTAQKKDPGILKQTKKGQPPPNPVKKHPDYVKMSQERLALVEELKKINSAANPIAHAAKKKEVQDMEVAMATFKLEHGRSVVPPSVHNAQVQAEAKSSN